MRLYVIVRRNGWTTPEELGAAAEDGGALGTFCIYEADGPDTIRAHAEAAGLPVDEIVPVADTVIVRADPVPV